MSLLKIRNEQGIFEPAQVLDIESMVGGGYEYSEEEKVVGKWVDGKPIYRKVYFYTHNGKIAVNTFVDTSPNIDMGSVDVLAISGVALVYKDGGVMTFPINGSGHAQNVGVTAYLNDGNLIRSFTYMTINSITKIEYKIIIEYTKTTDEPNSFTLDMLTTGDIDISATDAEVEEVFG